MASSPPPPTLLVLGAGASLQYGYPAGRDLIFEIIEGLKQPVSDLALTLQECGQEWSFLAEFRDDLRRSNLRSIDTFLDQRPPYRDCGKQAIAACLLPKEKEESVWRDRNQNWYEYVFNEIHPWIRRIPDAVQFVTFNYDRSLEFSLLHSFMSGLGLPLQEATTTLERMSIVHVHGLLSSLSERPYGTVNAEAVRRAANGIRIVGDECTDGASERACGWVSNAARICFLGFGFHPDNLRAIGLPNRIGRTTRVYSTGIGLLQDERRAATTAVGRTIEFGGNALSYDCLWTLREYGILSA